MPRDRAMSRLVYLLVLAYGAFATTQYLGYEPVQRVRIVESHFFSRTQIENDLRLQLDLDADSQAVICGNTPRVRVTLVNTSTTLTHRVVDAGNGSEIGHREPYFHWSGTRLRGDGTEEPIARARVGHCGLYLVETSMWEKDWVVLKPGQRLELYSYLLLDFQQAGRTRLQAHYDFRGDRGTRSSKPDERGLFGRVPPFTLSSNFVEFNVERPLDLNMRVKRALKVDEKTKLSDLFEVTLVNRSDRNITCPIPTPHSPDGRLTLELDANFGGWCPQVSEQWATYAEGNVVLKPGASVPVLGLGEFANGKDGWWTYPRAEAVRVRAVFYANERTIGLSVASEWVTVNVVDK